MLRKDRKVDSKFVVQQTIDNRQQTTDTKLKWCIRVRCVCPRICLMLVRCTRAPHPSFKTVHHIQSIKYIYIEHTCVHEYTVILIRALRITFLCTCMYFTVYCINDKCTTVSTTYCVYQGRHLTFDIVARGTWIDICGTHVAR